MFAWKIFGQWTAFLDPEGRVMDSKALRKKVFYGGVDHALRKEVYTEHLIWQFVTSETCFSINIFW
jgi:hypothetical protein